MRVLLSTYGSRGDVGPKVGLAVQLRALGAEVPVCAPPDFAELLARVGVPLMPVGHPVRPLVSGATPPSAEDLPRRAAELVAAQDDTGVDVEVSDGQSLRAEYLVGCDGGRSLIRRAAGIEFPGWDPTTSCLIAEVEMAEEPEWGLRRDDKGIHSLSRTGDGGPLRRCDILSRTHKGGSGWAATCWVSRRSTRRRSRSLAARARTWGSFRGSKASACRLAFA